MKLDEDKCKVMHFGDKKKMYEYEMLGKALSEVQ